MSNPIEEYNQRIQEISDMDPKDLDKMLREGKCPVPTELLKGVPLGMYHCELCGTMVIAGFPHGPMDPEWHPEKSWAAKAFYEQYPELGDEDGQT